MYNVKLISFISTNLNRRKIIKWNKIDFLQQLIKKIYIYQIFCPKIKWKCSSNYYCY